MIFNPNSIKQAQEVFCRKRQIGYTIPLNNSAATQTTSQKYLSVICDSRLTSNDQFNSVQSNTNEVIAKHFAKTSIDDHV